MILIIIFITILANLADLLLKVGASRAGDSIASDPLAIFLTPWIWLGAVLGIGAMALWVYILGRHHISLAYPIFVGVGFLNITLASWLFLDEQISAQRLAGIGLILAGIVLVHFQARGQTPASEERAG
jgi:multidrug transporter EmrE-like cation transporter